MIRRILAFCFNDSPGTSGCIDKARERHLNMIARFAYTPRPSATANVDQLAFEL